jgi:hypothetical protein
MAPLADPPRFRPRNPTTEPAPPPRLRQRFNFRLRPCRSDNPPAPQHRATRSPPPQPPVQSPPPPLPPSPPPASQASPPSPPRSHRHNSPIAASSTSASASASATAALTAAAVTAAAITTRTAVAAVVARHAATHRCLPAAAWVAWRGRRSPRRLLAIFSLSARVLRGRGLRHHAHSRHTKPSPAHASTGPSEESTCSLLNPESPRLRAGCTHLSRWLNCSDPVRARPPQPSCAHRPCMLHAAHACSSLPYSVCRCESRFCLWQATGPEATTPPAWSEGARLPPTQGRLAPGGHRARARPRALRIRPSHSHALRAATTPRAAAAYWAAVPGRCRAGPRPAAARPPWETGRCCRSVRCHGPGRSRVGPAAAVCQGSCVPPHGLWFDSNLV